MYSISNPDCSPCRRIASASDGVAHSDANRTQPDKLPRCLKNHRGGSTCGLRTDRGKTWHAERDDGASEHSRKQVMQIVKDKIEQHQDEPLSIEDLAFCTDVSVRTLRNTFLEYFGLPPGAVVRAPTQRRA